MTTPQPEQQPAMDLAQQIDLFLGGEQGAYQAFEILLKAVLSYGAKEYTYNSTVQARVKGPASFAEKCIRKQDKYTMPVHELTDLCGARVVTNTLDEVDRLCAFVERHLVVDRANSEDKLSILKTSEFAYRSVHFIVQVDGELLNRLPIQLDLEAIKRLKIDPPNLKGVVDRINQPKQGSTEPFLRKAEIQVRTIMQHVWADTLHDRTYKSGIQIPKALERESHRIAALLDKADEDLLHLNMQIDAYTKDYASHLSPKALEKELGIVQSLVEQESLKPKEKGEQVLRLLGLYASARQWKEILKNSHLKSTHDTQSYLDAFERLQALAKCRVHADNPNSAEFQSGLKTLEQLSKPVVLDNASRSDVGARLDFISEALAGSEDGHGRIQRDPVRSQLMADLAWARFRNTTDQRNKRFASETMFQAHLLDPSNPYIYGDQVWLQLDSNATRDFLRYSWTAIEDAMDRCRKHLEVGLDRNRGWATLGRFHLLRSEWSEAGQAYARLIASATASEILVDEWMLLDTSARILEDTPMAPYIELLVRTLRVAAALHDKKQSSKNEAVLVVAGTCAPDKSASIESFRNAVEGSIRAFKGIVISGGTSTGVAGMVEAAFNAGCLSTTLIGFMPRRADATQGTHAPYAELVQGLQPDFGIESVVQYWERILDDGYVPSQVRVLGVGGGPIGRFEYDLALALGATVGLVRGSGREADRLLDEDPWWDEGRLADLFDPESILLFCAHVPTGSVEDESMTDSIAKLAHEAYLADFGALPENLRPWKKLELKYKTANYDQASALPTLLGRFDLEVHPLTGAPDGMAKIATLESVLDKGRIVELARMEHARWSLERSRSGWRYGKERDNKRLLHPNMVPWEKLKQEDREKDINAVMAWPNNLEACGYGVYARPSKA